MAVILRSGTPRASSATVPIRTTTIEVAQTGLINKITDQDGKTIGVVNLGYQGDHNVTRIQIKPWRSAGTFGDYEAALVFYEEAHKLRNTLTMSVSGDSFILDVSQDITKSGGNYQLYFVLREKLDTTDAAGVTVGAIGAEDDPAYQEIFVSDVFKGAISGDSGYGLIKGFDWNTQVYNYNIGVLHSSAWVDNDNNTYTTTVYLGGLLDGTTIDKISITVPEEQLEIFESPTLTTKTLVVTVSLIDSSITDIESLLDQVEITYPVEFSATVSDNAAQKTPIKITHTASTIAATENSNLGMKLDAYVTPIDVSGLINIATSIEVLTTTKYIIFAKDNIRYVCEAQGDYGWIPIGVTSQAGVWSVSFVGKAESYTYYTGVLKLPVVDNVLFKQDITTDSVYSAVQDSDASYLYDSNNYALYAMSEDQSTVTLEYTGNIINQAIGWAHGMSEQYKVEDITTKIESIDDLQANFSSLETEFDALAEKVNNADVTDMREDVTELQGNVNDLKTTTANLTEKDSKLEESIKSLENQLAAADVTVLTNRVTIAEGDIDTLQTDLSTAETNITQLQGDVIGLNTRLTTAENEIDTLQAADIETNTKVSTNAGKIAILEPKVGVLESQVDNINATIEPYKNYADLISNEIADRAAADQNLQNQLDSEIIARQTADTTEANARQAADETLQSNIDSLSETVTTNKQLADAQIEELASSIQNEASTREAADANLQSSINTLDITTSAHTTAIDSHTTAITALQDDKTVVRNDYVAGAPKTIVASIVFITPDVANNKTAEDVYNDMVAAGTIDANTLYLIQEEE